MPTHIDRFCIMLVYIGLVSSNLCDAQEVIVSHPDGSTELSFNGNEVFHRTPGSVVDVRVVQIPGSPITGIVWGELTDQGAESRFYALSFDGVTVDRVRRISYEIGLNYASFDPAVGTPSSPTLLNSDAAGRVFIVQFFTQPLEAYLSVLRADVASVHDYVPNQAYLVHLDPAAISRVRALPFVRAVVPFHPAFRLEESLVDSLERGSTPPPTQRYAIRLFETTAERKESVTSAMADIGGQVEAIPVLGRTLYATLDPDQLVEIIGWDEVLLVERAATPGYDMNIARDSKISGANYLVTNGDYTGDGVRGDVMDGGDIESSHQAFQARPPIPHNDFGRVGGHMMNVFGTVFGDGTGTPVSGAKGVVPDAQGICAHRGNLSQLGGPLGRDEHTCELVGHPDCLESDSCLDDPDCPYNAEFQTNSWGTVRSLDYAVESAEIDDIIFRYDIIILNSQSNCGLGQCCGVGLGPCSVCDPTCSRPEAWGKNVVSVGGVKHHDTADKTDDEWDQGASIGPAEDWRIKPDLTHFYDWIVTTEPWNTYVDDFGGTSAATPITTGFSNSRRSTT